MCDTIKCAREITCHMGSHSVTCHPTEVILTPLPCHVPVLIYRPRMDERLSWPRWPAIQDGLQRRVTQY